jgi:hypothetical protein
MQNIGACGLNCEGCAAYKATQANDVEKLSELAVKWGGEKNKWTSKDMRCEGCTSSRISIGCNSCTVRICAQAKGAKICSRCGDYPCDKLQTRWSSLHGDVASWRANLEKAK